MSSQEPLTGAKVAALWQDDAVQDEAYDAMIRSLDKYGSFGLTGWLHWLATPGALTPEQVVALYSGLRGATSRNELEWREEFLTTFGLSATALPPPRQRDVLEFWDQTFFYAIGNRKLLVIDRGLRDLEEANLTLADLSLVDRMSLGEGLWMPVSEYTPPEDRLTLPDLADVLGYKEIGDKLRCWQESQMAKQPQKTNQEHKEGD